MRTTLLQTVPFVGIGALLLTFVACATEDPDEAFDMSGSGLGNTTWVQCASEGQTCTFTGTRRVRYGTEAANVIKSFTASTQCSNDVFGDPAVGTRKTCWYESTPCTPTQGQSTWVKCAEEHQICNFTGTRRVRYGTESANSIKTLTTTTRCENSVFGDPAVGIHKTCWYEETAPPVCDGSPTPPTPTTPPTTPPSPPATGGVIQATRVSGTAPLAVLFDSTGTPAAAGVDAFRQVTYAFDFGDERGQKWAVDGTPKNTQTGGPLAAHVFDVPGTYTVKVRATSPSGSAVEGSVTITVANPDTVYAGTKTVCVSPSSNWTGCPAGAARQTGLPSAWTGLRVLLHRGESFGGISIQDGNSAAQIGAYGTGAKPKVASVGVGDWRPVTAAFANDITAMDLDVQNGMGQSLGSRILFYRNDVHVAKNSATIAMTLGGEDYWRNGDPWRTVPQSAFHNAREIFYVENNAVGADTSSATYGIYGSGSRVALLGNIVGRQQHHSIRATAMHKSVIAHNDIQGISGDGVRHALKLHSIGLAPYADSTINGWASSQIVVAQNRMGNAADNNQWTVAVAPQNDEAAEGIEDVIVENNKFIRVSRTVTDLVVAGRRITSRGNTLSTGGAISTGTGHDGALPAAWKGPYFFQ